MQAHKRDRSPAFFRVSVSPSVDPEGTYSLEEVLAVRLKVQMVIEGKTVVKQLLVTVEVSADDVRRAWQAFRSVADIVLYIKEMQ